jgi:recombinational DNA repair ATPase RecF
MLAERLSQLGDVGALRLEKKLAQTASALERQREEFVASLNRRLGEVEAEFRQRLSDLTAEEEAERIALEARLAEISRRIEHTVARAEERLGSFSHVPP